MPAVKHQTKTRLVPTPSGFLHAGNVLSFALTASLAHNTGAKILLRIDDLDRTRANERYIQDIFDTLEYLEIPWQEGPRTAMEFEKAYSQIHRLDRYRVALGQLAGRGAVFACSCSRKQLADNNYRCCCRDKSIRLDSENVNWRFITDSEKEIAVKSYDGSIISAVLPAEMRNFIVKKRDGLPSYQLTSVIDDLFYNISLVVRGADLWPSTLAQLQLAGALNQTLFSDIVFFHHPILTEAAGPKLSKSAGSASINYMRKSGKTPGAIYTTIAQMSGSDKSALNYKQLGDVVLSILSP